MKRLLLGLVFCLNNFAFAYTPPDVYQLVEALNSDVSALRKLVNPSYGVNQPGVQMGKTPTHVYMKGIEVFDKVQRLRAKNRLSTSAPLSPPESSVTPAEIFRLVSLIRKELLPLLDSKGAEQSKLQELELHKLPSDVYERLWEASYQLDALVDPIAPKMVLANAKLINQNIHTVAEHLNVSLSVSKGEKLSGKTPRDASIEAYRVLYQITDLQHSVGLKPSRVPAYPTGDISPSEVFDITNGVLAELTRINIQLGIKINHRKESVSEAVTPNDVAAELMLIQSLLKQLTP